jgi:phosphatidylglycerophosphate synthase
MIDTHARKYFQPLFDKLALGLVPLRLSPNALTLGAFAAGTGASVAFVSGLRETALAALILSGILDVLDGTVARMTKTTHLGAFLDLTLDRVVEVAFVTAAALAVPDSRLSCVFVLGSTIFSFSVFLLSGNLVKKKSEKVFYYQAGLAERTETFIVFGLAILWPSYTACFFYIFAAMIAFTGGQRFLETYKYLGETEESR